MSFFSKIRDALSGLGKNLGSSPLFTKAKEFISGASDFPKNKNKKSIVDSVSKFIPQAQDYFKSAKDFSNMGNQFLNKGGLEKSFNRSMSGLPARSFDDIAKKFQDRFQGMLL